MLKIALIGLCLCLMSSPVVAGDTCRGVPMPPRSKQIEPTVYYDDFRVPRDRVAKVCGTPNYPRPAACAYSAPTAEHPDRWVMFIADDLPLGDIGCVVAYEKSHMPPNLWGDPNIEMPGTVQWLAAQSR